MSIKFYNLIIFFLILLTGCAITSSIDVQYRMRVFPKDYQTTLDACREFLDNNGWMIESINKEYGLIKSEFRSSNDFVSEIMGNRRYKIQFSIKGTTIDTTRVIATVLTENVKLFGQTSEQVINEYDAIEIYDNIFNQIGTLLGFPGYGNLPEGRTGILVDDQATVIYIISYSPASQSSIKVGDKIVEINDSPIPTGDRCLINSKLVGEIDTWVKLKIKKKNEVEITVSLKRKNIHDMKRFDKL